MRVTITILEILKNVNGLPSEAVVQCSINNVFLKFFQNSQESTRASFSIKLQTSGYVGKGWMCKARMLNPGK